MIRLVHGLRCLVPACDGRMMLALSREQMEDQGDTQRTVLVEQYQGKLGNSGPRTEF